MVAPRKAAFLVFGLALVVGPGCFSGGDGAYCVEGLVGRRDPASGTCLMFGVECTDSGPVAAGTRTPLPAWATCEPDACERFDEDACRTQVGCHPVYLHSSTCTADYRLIDTLWFHACWTVAPPADALDPASCDLLGAEACSRRDDCAPLHTSSGLGTAFEACTSEDAPTARDAKHRRIPPEPDPTRDPQTGECRRVTGSYCTEPPSGWPDWGPCSSDCDAFATDEAGCLLAAGCRAIYAGAPSATPTFAACWQVPPSGPVSGSPCAGLDAHECSRHDDCAAEHELDAVLGVTAFVACRAEMVAP